jgi:hypothetical protein
MKNMVVPPGAGLYEQLDKTGKRNYLNDMSKNDSKSTRGISEVAAEILIVILVVLIAVVAYAAFSGQLNSLFFKKSVYIAGTAAVTGIPQTSGLSDDVLTFLPKAGDAFYLTGQTSGTTGTQVTLKALSPDGKILYPDASGLKGSLYGKTLYIYPNSSPASTQCNYAISDSKPAGSLRPMTKGTWTVQMIDENVHVLANTYTEKVTNGATSLPVAGGFIGGSTSQFYRTDCTPINQTSLGITTSNTGPGNMTVAYFNGSGSYITIPNDPTLSFTGDLSISLWFKPTTATTPSSDGSNWHQLIGKGVTNSAGSSSSNENDNYQLFQYGNQLLFEWNDATTGQHYQAYTTASSGTVSSANWNYVTVTISGGNLAVYNNGVAQSLTYDNSNVPGTNILPATSTPKVNLINNNNAVTVGKQNAASSSDNFYYSGYMGAVSLYNRGLTQAEINANLAGDTA